MNPLLDKIANSDKLVLVDFWANWCGPCKAMMPILDALQSEMPDQLELIKVDVDEHLELAVSMKIMGVPTFILYKNGVECWREPGTFTKDALKKIITSFEPACAQ
jgi:thioredoxin 1